jgi:hypothetical protein
MMSQMNLPDNTDIIFDALKNNDLKGLREVMGKISKQIANNELPADFSAAAAKKNNRSAMKHAAEQSLWSAIRIMAEFEKCNKNNTEHYQYALIYALVKNEMNAVSALLDAGTPLATIGHAWCENNTKEYALHLAIKNKNHTVLNTLLQSNGAKFVIHKTNKEGLTPTQYAYFSACSDDYMHSLMDFSKSLDEFNAGDLVCYIDWVHHAKNRDMHNALNKLCKHSLATSSKTNSPLHFLVKYSEKLKNLKETMGFLLANGFDQARSHAQEKTAVQLASETNWQCAEWLILDEFKRNPHSDNERFKVLHYEAVLLNAIKDNRLLVVELLLNLLENNNVLYFDDEGHELLSTALTTAINHNQNDMVSLLLQHGANCFDVRSPHEKAMLGIVIDKNTMTRGSSHGTLQNFAKSQPIFEIDSFIIANKLSVKKNSYTLANQYRCCADVLFQALLENSLSSENIGPAINHLKTCYIELLKNDQKKLRAYRCKLSNLKLKSTNASLQELTATTEASDPNTLLGTISIFIQIINDIKENGLPTIDLLSFDTHFSELTPILAHLKDYEQTINVINSYKKKIVDFLNTLSQTIDQTTWYYKGFFGNEKTGICGHMKKLKTTVDKIKNLSSLQENLMIELLNIFNEIKNILMTIPPNNGRDPRTQKFYDDQLFIIKSIGFRSFLQTATVAINTNHLQTLRPNMGTTDYPADLLLNYSVPSTFALAFDPLTNCYVPYVPIYPVSQNVQEGGNFSKTMGQFPSFNLLFTQSILNNVPPLYHDTRNLNGRHPASTFSPSSNSNQSDESNPLHLAPVFTPLQTDNRQIKGENQAVSALREFSIANVWGKNQTPPSLTDDNKKEPLISSLKP